MAKRNFLPHIFQHFPAKNPNPVFTSEFDGRVHFTNDAAGQLFGKCEREDNSMLPDCFQASLKKAVESGRKHRLEINIRDQIFLFDIVGDRKAGLIFFYGTDITEFKKTEYKFQENQSRFALAQKAANIGTWDWEIETGQILWHHGVESILGIENGKSFRYFEDMIKLVHPEDIKQARRQITRCVRKKKDYDFEHRIIRLDGTTAWLRQAGTIIKNKEGPERIIGIFLDITLRRQAREQLENEKSDLTTLVRQRTRELEHINKNLQNEIRERENYQQKLRLLSAELAMSEERQRRRIATQLHDDVIQTLVYSNLKMGSLIEESSDQTMDALQYIYSLNDQVIEKLRHVTYELSPPILYQFGLVAATEWLGEQYREQYGLKINVSSEIKTIEMDEEIQLILYQALRELLNNTMKHAGANEVRIEFKLTDHHLIIVFKDDGVGFDLEKIDFKAKKLNGFGIFNIGDRIEYIEGRFDIQSRPNQGTTVTIQTPIKKGN